QRLEPLPPLLGLAVVAGQPLLPGGAGLRQRLLTGGFRARRLGAQPGARGLPRGGGHVGLPAQRGDARLVLGPQPDDLPLGEPLPLGVAAGLQLAPACGEGLRLAPRDVVPLPGLLEAVLELLEARPDVAA